MARWPAARLPALVATAGAVLALGVVPARSQTTTTIPTTATTVPATATTVPTPTTAPPETQTSPAAPPERAAGALTPAPAAPRATRHILFAGVVGSFTDSEPGTVRDSRAFVAAAYRHLLGRAVDRGAEAAWVSALEQRAPRARLVAVLLGSDEGRRFVVRRLYQAAVAFPGGPNTPPEVSRICEIANQKFLDSFELTGATVAK